MSLCLSVWKNKLNHKFFFKNWFKCQGPQNTPETQTWVLSKGTSWMQSSKTVEFKLVYSARAIILVQITLDQKTEWPVLRDIGDKVQTATLIRREKKGKQFQLTQLLLYKICQGCPSMTLTELPAYYQHISYGCLNL